MNTKFKCKPRWFGGDLKHDYAYRRGQGWSHSGSGVYKHRLYTSQDTLGIRCMRVVELGVLCIYQKVRNNPARNRGLRWETATVRHKHQIMSSIPAGSTIIYRFLCGFICVSLCQSIKIKPTNMYIARAQFKINTHRCWNWHLCIPDGLSVVQCSHGHVIGVAFFGAISVAWRVRAGQLAAGGVASVWRSWVRSLPGPR